MNKNPVFQRDFLYEVFTELTQERVFFERNAIPSSSQFHVNEVGYFLAGYFRESLFQFFDYGVYIEADTPLFKARSCSGPKPSSRPPASLMLDFGRMKR